MKYVFLGLSLSSSWGNGHATTYRALLRALAARGNDILFLERDQPWYARHRDLPEPDFCALRFYAALDDLPLAEIAHADVVILGSYVPEGAEIARLVQDTARGVTAFYDIDTPVTIARLEMDNCAYLDSDVIPGFHLYLSFTGGPMLDVLERQYGAQAARALYCSVDPERYRAIGTPVLWDLGYLGTYSTDRQPAVERLLIEPARRAPHLRFVVAGAQYPDGIAWPANVTRIEHLPPAAHASFYSSLRWTLNITRTDMVAAGYSPSVRIFEAGACGTPIISDRWAGIETILSPGTELMLAETSTDVLRALASSQSRRNAVADAARVRILASHTAAHRARELEAHVRAARARRPLATQESRL